MTIIDTARQRLQEADGLAAVLDAAYAAFEGLVSIIHPVQDPASGLFTAFVMAAASAADGRNAWPSHPRCPGTRCSPRLPNSSPGPVSRPERVARVVAGLSRLVADRLTQAAAAGLDTGDRYACRHAAQSARDICGLLSTGP